MRHVTRVNARRNVNELYCNTLQHTATHYNTLSNVNELYDCKIGNSSLIKMSVAVWCSVLRRAVVCYSVLQCFEMCCSVLQCVAVRCSVLQCVTVCCSRITRQAIQGLEFFSYDVKYSYISHEYLNRI